MTRLKFKHLVFFFLIIGASFHVSAQENPFIGKWELTGIPPDAGISFQKYFNSEGEFYNTRTVKSGIFKSHSGKYVVKDNLFIWKLWIRRPTTAAHM